MKNFFCFLLLTIGFYTTNLVGYSVTACPSNCNLPWNHEKIIDTIYRRIKYTFDSVYFHRDSVRILSWFQAKAINFTYDNDNKYVSGILFWLSYHDSSSVQHWWIMRMFAFQSTLNQFPSWKLENGSLPHIYNEYFAHWGRHFTEKPTNEDIYRFSKSNLLIVQPFYLWKKNSHILIASEVCATTWREVVGEEPTEFFRMED